MGSSQSSAYSQDQKETILNSSFNRKIKKVQNMVMFCPCVFFPFLILKIFETKHARLGEIFFQILSKNWKEMQ